VWRRTAVIAAIEKYYGKTEPPRKPAAAPSKWRAGRSKTCELADTATSSCRGVRGISAEMLAKQGEEAPVIKLVNVILMSAIQKGASDIHIEPYEKELRVRYRMDGISTTSCRRR